MPIGIFAQGYEPPTLPLPGTLTQPAPAGLLAAIAGEDIPGHRAVYLGVDGLAYLANPNLITGYLMAGVVVEATPAGSQLVVRLTGKIYEAGWDWGFGNIWLGPGGTLTQIIPDTGPLVRIGVGSGKWLFLRVKLVAIR